jgi:DNA polymerase-3 subunit delta
MIIKNFELKNKFKENICYYLLFGSNVGLIEETINKILIPKLSKNIFKYEEEEVISNIDSFVENITTGSLFDEDKLIIISRASDRLLEIIKKIIEKKIANVKIILKSQALDKKSKIRIYFEKSDQTFIVPFYEDDQKSLLNLAKNILNESKIKITPENLNLILQKAAGSRINLNNELKKIIQYCQNKSSISRDEILKITNLAENFKISDLVDSYLLDNKKKLTNIINENNVSEEENMLILRTFLNKLKKLKKLRESMIDENVELAISKFKPLIFWKDKDIIKKQLKMLNLKQINILIKNINYLELEIKKNFGISKNLINNFFLERKI